MPFSISLRSRNLRAKGDGGVGQQREKGCGHPAQCGTHRHILSSLSGMASALEKVRRVSPASPGERESKLRSGGGSAAGERPKMPLVKQKTMVVRDAVT